MALEEKLKNIINGDSTGPRKINVQTIYCMLGSVFLSFKNDDMYARSE